MQIFRRFATAAALVGCVTGQSAYAADKQNPENNVIRAKILDGSNLEKCRFLDTVFGQGGGGLTSSQSGVAKALQTAKFDASENAIGRGANAIVFTGIAVTLNYYVVMANAYECPA